MQITYICMMRFKLFFLVVFIAFKSFATHNRAGYISYKYNSHTGGYTFRIYTYTNPTSYSADKCEQTLLFMNPGNAGHVVDSLRCVRINSDQLSLDLHMQTPPLADCGTSDGHSIPGEGQILLYPYTLPNLNQYGGVKLNIYEGEHAPFPGSGDFIVGMVDPNLDRDIQNIGNGNGSSQDVAFALLDTIHLSNGAGAINNTPLVTNPPIDNACYHQTFCYNPGMIDSDNDSLSYSLTNFLTGDGHGNFFIPSQGTFIPAGISVNPVTGQLCWTATNGNFSDQAHGEYEIDITIKEYRKNPIDGTRFEVGSMIFAIQLLVEDCPSNATINITPPATACIIAGNPYVSQAITAIKPTSNSVISLTASGTPINGTHIGPNASFSFTGGISSATGQLSWTPSCQAVSLNPYYVTIQGSDNNTPANTNYTTLTLQVISPPVKNFTDSVKGDSIKLQWQAPIACSANQYNKINSYLIYRAAGCVSYTPNTCQTGVPASSGYVLIGTIASTTANPVFYDGNNGLGLPPGNSYSYLVVAKFDDGSLSAPQTNGPGDCITLHFGVPIITNVSVDTTDAVAGSIQVKWKKPILGSLNFDTTKAGNGGPYYFSLHKQDASGTYTTTLYNSALKTYFSQLKTQADTMFIDTLIDTQNRSHTYKVYFYANGSNKGSSAPASSIFASGVGHDKKVALSWTSHTPWIDTLYYIYRQNYTNAGYTLIDSTRNTTDTIKNLTNNYNYCFKILSVGTYNNPNIISPLFNFSQKVCVRPIDDVPPCQPKLKIAGDCDAAINKLTWANPNHACGINDVLKYYIYYTPREDSALVKIDSVLNVNDTTYSTNVNTESIAGCYVVVAVDSAGNQSALNNESCTDNCPIYELPNIFTPNGDNTNDLYIPVKNRFIQSVDFVMYNRWGEIVYEANDPKLGWDGKSKQMKQPVPDGVYFYTCTYYEIHYYGLKEYKLKGFVQILK